MDVLRQDIGDIPLYWALLALLIPQFVTLWVAHRGNEKSAETAREANANALAVARESGTVASELDHQTWLRDQRTALYFEATEWLAGALRGTEQGESRTGDHDERRITTRLQVLAPDSVIEAWQQCLASMVSMHNARDGAVSAAQQGAYYLEHKDEFYSWRSLFEDFHYQFVNVARDDLASLTALEPLQRGSVVGEGTGK